MVTKSSKLINLRDRGGLFQELDQKKNLQLESLYLREANTRIQVWKQYQDEIANQRRYWPPPINGKIYNKREEAIYSINTNNSNYNSWFHRHIYENDLIKTTQRRHMMYDLTKYSPCKETKLEKEVNQLKEKLKSYQINNPDCYSCLETIHPVISSLPYIYI